jgi:hypothetical protein
MQAEYLESAPDLYSDMHHGAYHGSTLLPQPSAHHTSNHATEYSHYEEAYAPLGRALDHPSAMELDTTPDPLIPQAPHAPMVQRNPGSAAAARARHSFDDVPARNVSRMTASQAPPAVAMSFEDAGFF